MFHHCSCCCSSSGISSRLPINPHITLHLIPPHSQYRGIHAFLLHSRVCTLLTLFISAGLLKKCRNFSAKRIEAESSDSVHRTETGAAGALRSIMLQSAIIYTQVTWRKSVPVTSTNSTALSLACINMWRLNTTQSYPGTCLLPWYAL